MPRKLKKAETDVFSFLDSVSSIVISYDLYQTIIAIPLDRKSVVGSL